MGLLQRIFGNGDNKETASRAGSTAPPFHESETASSEEESSRNVPRRELVQGVLRDTVRKHGIPSDWIECRILSTVSRSGRSGIHVTFVVRQAHEQLLGYVFAFQDSFENELARLDQRAGEWLLSIGWEFRGHQLKAAMPDPKIWASLQAGASRSARKSRRPLAGNALTSPAPDDPVALEQRKSDDDVQRDLEALFAIRDAAMADAAQNPVVDVPDFEPTQPFVDFDSEETRNKRR